MSDARCCYVSDLHPWECDRPLCCHYRTGLSAQIAVLEELSGGYDIRIAEVKEKLAELRKELGE